ncbi:MAG: glycosyltransferase family 4 protein [Hyphomonadaceae bacterium]|nr:glycosyltransferase family 4 protein [Hyphomonadaceae bacterium]
MSKKLRIAHICLASSYTEGMNYQDNILPAQNRADGHEVLVVADCTCYSNGKKITVSALNKTLDDGVRLVRLPFAGRFMPAVVRERVRWTPGLRDVIKDFRPDVILYHGLVGVELLTVGGYKRENPGVRLYMDSHMDSHNSGQSAVSRLLQYKVMNRFLWNCIRGVVDKVFYVSYESRDFLHEIFRIPEQSMEFLPLGGFVKNSIDRARTREATRGRYGFSAREVVFLHSGKFNRLKKTLQLLRAFSRVDNSSYRLVLVGSFDEDIDTEAKALIDKDSRVSYLGWRSGAELQELLCASDCYVQPGTQSATLQSAICCALPVLIFPYSSHRPYMVGNGRFVADEAELAAALKEMESGEVRSQMSASSLAIAEKLLDYRLIARRLYC